MKSDSERESLFLNIDVRLQVDKIGKYNDFDLGRLGR